MMSLQTIRQVSRDAAIRAARENRIPFTIEGEDLNDWKRRLKAGTLTLPFPFLGDYVPQGWKRTHREPLFCDHSGFGTENEPAMTVRALLEALIPGKAYAVIETGPFQLYLAEFERNDGSPGNESEFVGLTSDEESEFQEIIDQESQENHKSNAGTDVVIRFECSICLFEPKTDRARQWIKKHVLDPNWFGRFLVVEQRYAKAIASGMRSSKLRIA